MAKRAVGNPRNEDLRLKITKAERDYLEALKENTPFAYMTVHEFAVYLLGLGKGEHVLKEGLYLERKEFQYGPGAAGRIASTAFHFAAESPQAFVADAMSPAIRERIDRGHRPADHPPPKGDSKKKRAGND